MGLVCDCGSSLNCFLSSIHHPIKINVSGMESRVFLSDPSLLLLTTEDEHIPRGLSTWGRACKPGRWEIRGMSLHVEVLRMGRSLANWARNSTARFSRHFWEQNRASMGQGWALVRDISLSRRGAHFLFSHQLEAEHNVSDTIVLPCVESFVSSSTQPQKATLRHSWVHTTHSTSHKDAQHYYVRPLSLAETPAVLYAFEMMYAASYWKIFRFLHSRYWEQWLADLRRCMSHNSIHCNHR